MKIFFLPSVFISCRMEKLGSADKDMPKAPLNACPAALMMRISNGLLDGLIE